MVGWGLSYAFWLATLLRFFFSVSFLYTMARIIEDVCFELHIFVGACDLGDCRRLDLFILIGNFSLLRTVSK